METTYVDPLQKLGSYPASLDVLDRAEVIYHEMPGWNQSTTNVKTFEELPQEAQDYILVRNVMFTWNSSSH